MRTQHLGAPGLTRLGARRFIVFEFAAHDHFNDLRVGEVGHRAAGDVLAVAQHGHAVAKAAHLGQAVGDEDHGHAFALLRGDEFANPLHVSARECGGGLVQQEDAGFAQQRAGNFQFLLNRQIEVLYFLVQIDGMQAQFIQKGPDACACGAAVDDAQPVGRAIGQQQVVKNCQVLDVRHFLERGMNPQSVRRFGVADADG